MLEVHLETEVCGKERKQEMQRLLRFLVVGAIANLACFTGAYHSLLWITGTSAASGMAFLADTECSLVCNFLLNDRLTFGNLHHPPGSCAACALMWRVGPGSRKRNVAQKG